jgi:hypothetical protein
LIEKGKNFENVWSQNERCSWGDIEHSEFASTKQQMSMNNKDRKALYRMLYCGIMDTG